MNSITVKRNPIILSIRWLARLLSLLSIGLFLLIFIGEEFDPTVITFREWVGLFFFPFGITVGMILAWWREAVGGAITIGSLLAFYLVDFILSGDFPGGPFFLLFALPGFLFLICAKLEESR